jgi:paraquat-inducible protein B
MADTPQGPDAPDVPQAVAVPGSRWKLQIIWLIPLVAALIGGWLAVRAILEKGPTITISFKTAEGVEAGKTKLKYKEVDIGLVTSVTLSKDLSRVVATAELVKDFKPHLVEDTRFWVVRPRISGGTVSGIGTVLSGAYIGVDVGRSSQAKSDFAGLEVPPIVSLDMPGQIFTLHAENIGSIDAGVPVFFRQLPVGQVTGYVLDSDGKGVTVKVFVNAPYVKYVTTNTRFWNASGIKVKLEGGGVKIETQSLVSIVIGGVAFDNPPADSAPVPASEKTGFVLFPDRDAAMKNPETEVFKMAMVFEESVRGLAVGAPVDFEGISVGEVAAVELDIDPETGKIVIPVEIDIYPQRFRLHSRAPIAYKTPAERQAALDALVKQGLRAQLRVESFLSGGRYISLSYFKNQPKGKINWAKTPPEMPTVKGDLQEIQTALSSVANKLDKIPYEQLGDNLTKAITTANALLVRLDGEVAPEAREALKQASTALRSADRLLAPEHSLQRDASDTMRELAHAAQAIRVLADYLERHPEALIRGKKEDEK